jgi:6-phosphofructokinase
MEKNKVGMTVKLNLRVTKPKVNVLKTKAKWNIRNNKIKILIYLKGNNSNIQTSRLR